MCVRACVCVCVLGRGGGVCVCVRTRKFKHQTRLATLTAVFPDFDLEEDEGPNAQCVAITNGRVVLGVVQREHEVRTHPTH